MQFVSPLRHRRDVFAARARELHLWLLEVIAWLLAHFRAPRFMKLELRRDLRAARSEIRELIVLSMISRLCFRTERPPGHHRPQAALGFRRRRTRVVHALTRGIALRTPRDMRVTLEKFDTIVECAITRMLNRPRAHGAVVTVFAVTIAMCTSAVTPDAKAADTS